MSRRDMEEGPQFVDYRYSANQNIVLTMKNRARVEGPTGEVESLKGKLTFRMGDLAKRTNAPKRKKGQGKKKKKRRFLRIGRKKSVLDSTAVGQQYYQPKTEENAIVFESMLHFVLNYVGDVNSEAVHACVDEVLAVIKNEEIADNNKFKNVEDILPGIDPDSFQKLLSIGKRITDYFPSSPDDGKDVDDDEVDREDIGMSLVFDKKDEEDDEEKLGQGGMYVDYVNEKDEDEEEGGVNYEDTSKDEMLSFRKDKDSSKEQLPLKQISRDFIIQKLFKRYYPAEESARLKFNEIIRVLGKHSKSDSEVENELAEKLDFRMDLVRVLMVNRWRFVYVLQINDAKEHTPNDSVRVEQIFQEMGKYEYGRSVLSELKMNRQPKKNKMKDDDEEEEGEHEWGTSEPTGSKFVPSMIDLSSLAFDQGSHLMTNKECTLPENTVRETFKGYEEIHIPAPPKPEMKKNERLVDVKKDLPKWTHPAFLTARVSKLNRMQSEVYPEAFGNETSDNLLVCAPTGAGKTNVAVLAILNELRKHIVVDENGGFKGLQSDSNFKIVYVAPMKALVQEVVGKLRGRFEENYGVKVGELTGDSSMTNFQLNNTHIIVSTPEKWDIVSRKTQDRTFIDYVRCIIIDEIHLLHDERGHVLEAIVSRTLRFEEQRRKKVRLVGISATLPNYEDVAMFCRVKKKCCFHFSNAYRPVPLDQYYIGVSERKILKKLKIMNEICFEKVMERSNTDHQIIIFVHSRKETGKTARFIYHRAKELGKLGKLLGDKKGSREILKDVSENEIGNEELKEFLPFGIAIHHAGMVRKDRGFVEDLFDGKHIRVLISTATLAWGVNLPAHTVIIKGTEIYNAERGQWMELSSLDVMQMMGRAGRPGKDVEGEGILITTSEEVMYYLSLFSAQLPIESQFIKRLCDHLNAEVVMGSISTVKDAVEWLGYTYLYVRMMRNPELYGVDVDEVKRRGDLRLEQRRRDLIYSAAKVLAQSGMVIFNENSGDEGGVFESTEIGRIGSFFYIPHSSMCVYNKHLRSKMSYIQVLRVFSLSEEFKFVIVRQEEKLELMRLYELVPIPIKENIIDESGSSSSSSTKINILLQTFISRLGCTCFSLVSDLSYITASAVRILRAMFEICLRKKWVGASKKMLKMCKMIEKRMWMVQNPLRQFMRSDGSKKKKGKNFLSHELIYQLEKKDLTWDQYYDLSVAELGELIRNPKGGRDLYRKIHQFPRLEVTAHVQPIRHNLLKFEMILQSDFEYVEEIHGPACLFHIFIEDSNEEQMLHYETFLLQKRYVEEEHYLSFHVMLPKKSKLKLPIVYIRVISDRWVGSETTLPVVLQNMAYPKKEKTMVTNIIDQFPIPLKKAFGKDKNELSLYSSKTGSHLGSLSPMETQIFPVLFLGSQQENALICSNPRESNIMQLLDIYIYRKLIKKKDTEEEKKEEETDETSKIVYICPFPEKLDDQYGKWKKLFGESVVVSKLTGFATVDLDRFANGRIVCCLPEHFDLFTRKWKKYRVFLKLVDTVIFDDIHLIGGGSENSCGGSPGLPLGVSSRGHVMEMLILRMNFLSTRLFADDEEEEEEEEEESKKMKDDSGKKRMRILGLGYPIDCPRDLSHFLNIENKSNILNFRMFSGSNEGKKDDTTESSDVWVICKGFSNHVSFTNRTLSMLRRFCTTQLPKRLQFRGRNYSNSEPFTYIVFTNPSVKLVESLSVECFVNIRELYFEKEKKEAESKRRQKHQMKDDGSSEIDEIDEEEMYVSSVESYNLRYLLRNTRGTILFYHNRMSGNDKNLVFRYFYGERRKFSGSAVTGKVEDDFKKRVREKGFRILFVPSDMSWNTFGDPFIRALYHIPLRKMNCVVLGTDNSVRSSVNSGLAASSASGTRQFGVPLSSSTSTSLSLQGLSNSNSNNVNYQHSHYSLHQLLQMLQFSTDRKTIFTNTSKYVYYSQFFREFPFLSLESQIDHSFSEHMNVEICSTEMISKPQHILDMLSKSLLYFRIFKNPNYYNLDTERHVQEFMSQFVEHCIEDLVTSKCIEYNKEEAFGKAKKGEMEGEEEEEEEEEKKVLEYLNLGRIASECYVSYNTVDLFDSSLTTSTRIKGLLEIISASTEFEGLAISRNSNQDSFLLKISKYLPLKILGTGVTEDSKKAIPGNSKIHMLLQCHFSRIPLHSGLKKDQEFVLSKCIPNLLDAILNIVNINQLGLKITLSCLELSQMLVQGMWDHDSYLKQIPHFSDEMIEFLKNVKKRKSIEELSKVEFGEIENVFDLIEMEDEDRMKILNFFFDKNKNKLLQRMEREVKEIGEDSTLTSKEKSNLLMEIENEKDRLLANSEVEKKAKFKQLAGFLNTFPNIDVKYKFRLLSEEEQKEMDDDDDDEEEDEVKHDMVAIQIQFETDEDDEEEEEQEDSNFSVSEYFKNKKNDWYILIGDPKRNILYKMKRIRRKIMNEQVVNMAFRIPRSRSGEKRNVHFYFMADSLLGCDQEYNFEI